MDTCPKCGYLRTPKDIDKPDDQCPSCGVYYAKAVRAIGALKELKAKKEVKNQKTTKSILTQAKPPKYSRQPAFPTIKIPDLAMISDERDLRHISIKRKIWSILLTAMLFFGTAIAINKQFSSSTIFSNFIATPIKPSDSILNDYSVVQAAKMNIAEQYAYNGTFPNSNMEARIAPPEKFRGMTLLSLTISEGGRINLEFDALSGHDGGLIQIIPDSSLAESIGLQWRCMTSDYPDIDKIIKNCKYIEKN